MPAGHKIGIIVSMARLLAEGTDELLSLGVSTCQLNNWDVSLATRDNAARIRDLLAGEVEISSLWAGWPGPAVWDLVDGPATLGLVPSAFGPSASPRSSAAPTGRLAGGARRHHAVGFIPENPSTTEYREAVVAVREGRAVLPGDLGLTSTLRRAGDPHHVDANLSRTSGSTNLA